MTSQGAYQNPRQGYQNIVNVVNEEPVESQSDSFVSSSLNNLGSNLGVNMSEEQLQYSSYYNTYFSQRRKSRNTTIAITVTGMFVFFAFVNFISSSHSPAAVSNPPVVANEEAVPTPDLDAAAKIVKTEPSSTDWSTRPIAEQYVHYSEEANKRFLDRTSNTDEAVPSGCEGTVLIMPACETQSMNSKQFFHQHCNYIGFERAQYLTNLFGDFVLTTDRRRKRSLQAVEDEKTDGNTTANQDGMTALEAEVGVAEEVSYLVTEAFISKISVKWPVPFLLYALSPHKRDRKDSHPDRNIFRELELLTPLGDKFDVVVDTRYGESQEDMEMLSDELFKNLTSGDMCGKTAVIAWNHEFIPKLAQSLGCGPLEGCPLEFSALEFDEVWSIKYVYEPAVLPQIMLGEDFGNGKIMTEEDKEKKMGKFKGWEMFGSTVKQGFDPLRFSALVGDYKSEGVDAFGNWIKTKE